MEAVLPRTYSRVFCLAWGRRSSEAEFRACIARLIRLEDNLGSCLQQAGVVLNTVAGLLHVGPFPWPLPLAPSLGPFPWGYGVTNAGRLAGTCCTIWADSFPDTSTH